MTQNWVDRFIAAGRELEREESQRAQAGIRLAERRAARLQSYMDVLEEQIAGDVVAFAREFPERRVRFERSLGGGFSVRREHYPEVHLVVTPNDDSGTIQVQYVFAMQTGTVAPPVFELVPEPGASFVMRVQGGRDARTLRGAEQASEYLLVPVFTGVPRDEEVPA
ncbi:MAG TPA: hypothetical protein VF198_00905 [Vicinamibacterales bacterium]